MAEGKPQEEGSGSWWDGWLQTAKEKSSAALELVKKDLSEFTCTVRTDTSNVVAATSDTLQETVTTEKREPAMAMVKSGISSFLDGITRVLTIPPDDDPGDQLTIQPNGEATYDRGRARLTAIQLDPGTYCSQPSGSPEQYEMWRDNFDLESKKGDISEMLVSRVEVRALYTKLVPSEVSHADFWARYFYKVHQLELDEARKVALMRRAEQTREESFTWDDDEGSDGEDKGSPGAESSSSTDVVEEKKKTQTSDRQHSNTKQPASPQTVTDLSETFVKANLETRGSNPDMVQCPENRVPSPEKEESTDQPASARRPEGNSPATVPYQETTAGQDTSHVPHSKENLSKDCEKETKSIELLGQPVSLGTSGDIGGEQTKPCSLPGRVQGGEEGEGKADDKVLRELRMKEKGDMVVVGSGSSSPISESSANIKKDTGGGEVTDEDWDEDFDIELTEEDIRLAEEAAKKYKSPETLEDLDMMEDDWNWD